MLEGAIVELKQFIFILLGHPYNFKERKEIKCTQILQFHWPTQVVESNALEEGCGAMVQNRSKCVLSFQECLNVSQGTPHSLV